MSFKDHFQLSEPMPLHDELREPGKKIWVNFLPNIDFGHLLTMAGFAGALFVQWNAIDKRLTIVEQQTALYASVIADAKSSGKESMNEVRSDIKQIKDSVIAMQSDMKLTTYKLEQQQQGKK